MQVRVAMIHLTKQAFSEIIDLMQKTSGDKKIDQAVGDTNEETELREIH